MEIIGHVLQVIHTINTMKDNVQYNRRRCHELIDYIRVLEPIIKQCESQLSPNNHSQQLALEYLRTGVDSSCELVQSFTVQQARWWRQLLNARRDSQEFEKVHGLLHQAVSALTLACALRPPPATSEISLYRARIADLESQMEKLSSTPMDEEANDTKQKIEIELQCTQSLKRARQVYMEKRYDEAVRILREIRDIRAQYLLGWILYNGGHGVEQDRQQAAHIFKEGAYEHEHVSSMFMYATCLYNGYGVEVDLPTAAKLFAKVTERDVSHGPGAFMLASCYNGGKGVEMDKKQAAKWFLHSANLKRPWGQFMVGTFYERGMGDLPKDMKSALHWYRLAADQGLEKAKAKVHIMEK